MALPICVCCEVRQYLTNSSNVIMSADLQIMILKQPVNPVPTYHTVGNLQEVVKNRVGQYDMEPGFRYFIYVKPNPGSTQLSIQYALMTHQNNHFYYLLQPMSFQLRSPVWQNISMHPLRQMSNYTNQIVILKIYSLASRRHEQLQVTFTNHTLHRITRRHASSVPRILHRHVKSDQIPRRQRVPLPKQVKSEQTPKKKEFNKWEKDVDEYKTDDDIPLLYDQGNPPNMKQTPSNNQPGTQQIVDSIWTILENKQVDCCMCLKTFRRLVQDEEYQTNDIVINTPCRHVLCSRCAQLLLQADSKPRCPLCSKTITDFIQPGKNVAEMQDIWQQAQDEKEPIVKLGMPMLNRSILEASGPNRYILSLEE